MFLDVPSRRPIVDLRAAMRTAPWELLDLRTKLDGYKARSRTWRPFASSADCYEVSGEIFGAERAFREGGGHRGCLIVLYCWLSVH
jgi:hypothetical protein